MGTFSSAAYLDGTNQSRRIILNSRRAAFSITVSFLVVGAVGFAQELRVADSVIPSSSDRLLIASYACVGGGAALMPGALLPKASFSGGSRFSSWLALGAFVEGVPLSDFDHASFGFNAADRANAYMLSSGTELIITPFASSMLHPLFKIAVGGSSAGYLEDIDGEEGFDRAVDQRFFFAAAAVGLELNLHRCWLLSAHVGGRFVGNSDTLGIRSGGLSGLEAGIGIRVLYGLLFE